MHELCIEWVLSSRNKMEFRIYHMAYRAEEMFQMAYRAQEIFQDGLQSPRKFQDCIQRECTPRRIVQDGVLQRRLELENLYQTPEYEDLLFQYRLESKQCTECNQERCVLSSNRYTNNSSHNKHPILTRSYFCHHEKQRTTMIRRRARGGETKPPGPQLHYLVSSPSKKFVRDVPLKAPISTSFICLGGDLPCSFCRVLDTHMRFGLGVAGAFYTFFATFMEEFFSGFK